MTVERNDFHPSDLLWLEATIGMPGDSRVTNTEVQVPTGASHSKSHIVGANYLDEMGRQISQRRCRVEVRHHRQNAVSGFAQDLNGLASAFADGTNFSGFELEEHVR